MAFPSLRLRRAIALSASFLKHRPFSAAAVVRLPSPPLAPSTPASKAGSIYPTILGSPGLHPHCAIQHLSFRSSPPSSERRWGDGEERKLDPDEILFEGCDYNHWLITMDFPKDPQPTPEEMVETYVQTLAKVVGSVEEAKKRMYACSTTTYTGFQAVMTEEMSEKFRGLPGVVFILPDSYIDPINKEYGGDKYDNGVITPRPPPVQYGRQGRYGDRNRNYDRPRYDRQRDMMTTQQWSPSFDRRGPPQGEGRNVAPQQNYGQGRRGYGPPGGGNFGLETRDNFPGGRHDYQRERRDPTPAYQGGSNLGQGGNFPPQERRDFSQGQNYEPNYSGPREGQPLPHIDHQHGAQSEQRNFTYPPPTGTNQGR